MVDIMDQLGKKNCAELQKEFSTSDVKFFYADITDKDQLVSCSYIGGYWGKQHQAALPFILLVQGGLERFRVQ